MGKDRPFIVVINSSPRRNGMTAGLAQAAERGAQTEGARVTLIHLVEEELSSCRACGGDCWTALSCRHDPAAAERAARLQDADGLVLAVPVYCWQINSLASLFIDKMRWNTGSVLHPRNARAAMGIASAGGSGTGCVIALQTVYKYFANWAFRGMAPVPVTRFNYAHALAASEEGARSLVREVRAGIEPFADLGATMLHYEGLPYMRWGMLDELVMIVRQILEGLAADRREDEGGFATMAEEALRLAEGGDRAAAAKALSAAYTTGAALWDQAAKKAR